MTEKGGYGVGYQLLNTSAYDLKEVNLALQLLVSRRQNFGDGVVAIDCGANIGVHTIEWAQAMHGWGEVIAFEAQERIYYALAGNIALNNCFNAKAIWAAVGSNKGEISVPLPNYFSPSSFGSLELRKTPNTEFIGQQISYEDKNCEKINLVAIDQFDLNRLDFIKIDIEGMEMEALLGAKVSIEKSKPILMIEKIKSNEADIRNFLGQFGYQFFSIGINLLAVHPDDPISKQIKVA
jgi:FkbM family methyltransferase